MAVIRLSSTRTVFFIVLSFLSLFILPAISVKHESFKTCAQSGFCKRNRAYADTVTASGDPYSSPYVVDEASLKLKNGVITGHITKSVGSQTFNLPLEIFFLKSGVVRITIDEEQRQKGAIELRHDSKVRKERYNEASKWALVGGLDLEKDVEISKGTSGYTVVKYGPERSWEAVIRHAPFGVEFRKDGEKQIKLNDRGFMNVEQWRAKVDRGEGQETPEEENTWWEETFGGNTDSKPRGPESIAMDVTFFNYEHVYGIPEHTGPLSLRQTRGGDGEYTEPYRLYNSDVFEYILDSPMTLYGAIPFMQAHRKNSTVGVLWLNAAETWIDIQKKKQHTNPLALGIGGDKIDTQTHWISEAGILDVFIFLGEKPEDLTKKYGELTGYTQLPQTFAIGYHQCRWNYVSDEDVKDVDRKFDQYSIPYDVIWLDIEYTEEKKYFTWDPDTFPDPLGMGQQLDESDRKLVVIIDPHLKNTGNYHVMDELKSKDLATKNKDGNIYDGWCWPGSSHWIDCFNPAAIKWWVSLFSYSSFKGTMKNTFIWNDMNEPSVFNGPETTMPKDNIHYGGWEHRDVHNVNGLTFMNATYHALLARDGKTPKRPFVLTRSFYSGAQRLGAMWTGDNQAVWSHLEGSIPMVLNQGISGFPFAGADVGGFFGNPSKELQTRWYQAGAFYPFFRGHAHIDARRREPYLLGEPYTAIMTQAIRLRYSLLPAWYTAFHSASVDGSPIVRPQYYVHPEDTAGFAIDDQFYLGSTGLLVKPVTSEGATSVDVYVSDDKPYFDYFDFTIYQGAGKRHTVPAPLETIPVLMQAGNIIPRKDRPRKSTGLMRYDPFTLVVVLDDAGTATGELYIDDGESFDYESGAFIHRKFNFRNAALTSMPLSASKHGSKTSSYLKSMDQVRVERVVVVNAPSSWVQKTEVLVSEDGAKSGSKAQLTFTTGGKGKANYAVVRNPRMSIGKNWEIQF
ncbi:putative alpha glucosidase ii [Phaeomoniella chlamydospora]|uniref:alpha-glucosidase n=1 Tax=Phaeomoniella chlamydospora TaxID=158046 RepID=A0A0G2HJ69_PHACM|nr:putative alpha glucosidase ii [Phaeomoniella chlamydospora]